MYIYIYIYRLHDWTFSERTFHLIFLIPVDTCPQFIQRVFAFSQLAKAIYFIFLFYLFYLFFI